MSEEMALYCLVLGLEGVTILDGTTNYGRMMEDLLGIKTVRIWAEGEGKDQWEMLLREFKILIEEGSSV